jgi:hypothetical protein
MKIYISDKIFDINNISSGYNSLLLNELQTNNHNECILFFIENVTKHYEIYEYLNEKNKFNNYFWCENLKAISKYKIIVISNELLTDELLFYNPNNVIYYFCEKRNIAPLLNSTGQYNVKNNVKCNNIQKYLYLKDYDTIYETDKSFFTKIYTFNNIQADGDKVEFIRYNIYPRRFKMGRSCGASFEVVTGNLVEESNGVPFEFFNGVKRNDIITLFDNATKDNIKSTFNIKDDYIVIFIHLYDDLFYDVLDRIILAISELKKIHKIWPIFYWPIEKNINKSITKNDIVVMNDKMIYNCYNIDIPINSDLSNFNDNELLNINFSINIEHSLTMKESLLNILKVYIKDEYSIVTNIDDYKLLQYIYMADIYIPVTEELSYLTLVSQYYKTYTIFTNDSNNTQEYCIYGDIPLLKSNDHIYCSISDKIKRNMRTDDMKNSIENYIKNKENPFFVYKREFCEYLFG